MPANTSDPTFQRWIKSPLAGMILPNGGTAAQFRDPVAAWTVNGTYYSIVGTQVGCIGSASLYSSQDLTSWAYDGVLASQVNKLCATDAGLLLQTCNRHWHAVCVRHASCLQKLCLVPAICRTCSISRAALDYLTCAVHAQQPRAGAMLHAPMQ